MYASLFPYWFHGLYCKGSEKTRQKFVCLSNSWLFRQHQSEAICHFTIEYNLNMIMNDWSKSSCIFWNVLYTLFSPVTVMSVVECLTSELIKPLRKLWIYTCLIRAVLVSVTRNNWIKYGHVHFAFKLGKILPVWTVIILQKEQEKCDLTCSTIPQRALLLTVLVNEKQVQTTKSKGNHQRKCLSLNRCLYVVWIERSSNVRTNGSKSSTQ